MPPLKPGLNANGTPVYPQGLVPDVQQTQPPMKLAPIPQQPLLQPINQQQVIPQAPQQPQPSGQTDVGNGTAPNTFSTLNPQGQDVPWKNLQQQILSGNHEINKHPILSILLSQSPSLNAQRQINNQIAMTNQYLTPDKQLQQFEVNPFMGMSDVQKRWTVANLALKHVMNTNDNLLRLQQDLAKKKLEHELEGKWDQEKADQYSAVIKDINSAVKSGNQALKDPLNPDLFRNWEGSSSEILEKGVNYYEKLQQNQQSQSQKDLDNRVKGLQLQQQGLANDLTVHSLKQNAEEIKQRREDSYFNKLIQTSRLKNDLNKIQRQYVREAKQDEEKARKEEVNAVIKPGLKATKKEKDAYEARTGAILKGYKPATHILKSGNKVVLPWQ